MNTTAICLEKINKIFRTRHRDIHALSDVDLTVGQGEFVSLVGPSGCGKSTILRMLANIVRPTSGHISINGVEVSSRSRWPESLVRSIGLVFQAPNLPDWRLASTICSAASGWETVPEPTRPNSPGAWPRRPGSSAPWHTTPTSF